jgi:hypothetical protein
MVDATRSEFGDDNDDGENQSSSSLTPLDTRNHNGKRTRNCGRNSKDQRKKMRMLFEEQATDLDSFYTSVLVPYLSQFDANTTTTISPEEITDMAYTEFDYIKKCSEMFRCSGRLGTQSRLGRCIFAMYLRFTVDTWDDRGAKKGEKTLIIDSILKICGDIIKCRSTLHKYTSAGKHLLWYVKRFGWSVLLWDNIFRRAMDQSDEEIEEFFKYIDKNEAMYRFEERPHIRELVQDAEKLIIRLMSEGYEVDSVTHFVNKINSIIPKSNVCQI